MCVGKRSEDSLTNEREKKMFCMKCQSTPTVLHTSGLQLLSDYTYNCLLLICRGTISVNNSGQGLT